MSPRCGYILQSARFEWKRIEIHVFLFNLWKLSSDFSVQVRIRVDKEGSSGIFCHVTGRKLGKISVRWWTKCVSTFEATDIYTRSFHDNYPLPILFLFLHVFLPVSDPLNGFELVSPLAKGKLTRLLSSIFLSPLKKGSPYRVRETKRASSNTVLFSLPNEYKISRKNSKKWTEKGRGIRARMECWFLIKTICSKILPERPQIDQLTVLFSSLEERDQGLKWGVKKV